MLYNLTITTTTAIRSELSIKTIQLFNRTEEQMLSDIDHYRFIAPKGSMVAVVWTEAQ